jgi:hypothetical protein
MSGREKMTAVLERETLIERRQYKTEQELLWDKLSLAQKFAASSLNQYGYELAFLRSSGISSTAVLLRGNDVATVASDGEINTAPDIIIR